MGWLPEQPQPRASLRYPRAPRDVAQGSRLNPLLLCFCVCSFQWLPRAVSRYLSCPRPPLKRVVGAAADPNSAAVFLCLASYPVWLAQMDPVAAQVHCGKQRPPSGVSIFFPGCARRHKALMSDAASHRSKKMPRLQFHCAQLALSQDTNARKSTFVVTFVLRM